MKKLIALLAIVVLLLPSCQKINDRIDGLEDRIDQIEGTQIATINQQIEAINTTLPQLRETDTELKEYIQSLQTTATNLQEQITNTNKDIDELEAALNKAIADAEASDDALKAELVAQLNTAKADILAQLESTKTALEAELAQINSTIATLQAKDTELEGKITTLEEYVNTELQNTEDWATVTFATLEQYNTIVEDIATIKTQIEALNTSLTNHEERLNTKIATDIAAAVEGLQSELATKVTEITTAYTTAISTAKEEVTAAYTEAIAAAITNLESSMKEWVNEQLTGYYTIAETEAAIERLKGHITSGDAAFQEIEMLSQRMEDVKTEITEAYQKAIETAILENNGVIDSKIASEVTTINGRIDQEVATINAKITEIESRLDNIEAQITELLTRIQSVTYVPQYSDGKATMDYNTKRASFDFIISPKDAVPALASVWNEALVMKAIYTQTRAVEFIDLPITNFEADTISGVISITVSGENLKDEFYRELQDASVFLQISDGNSNIASEYIAMTPNYNIKFEDLNVKAICCKNWDTNYDGELSYEEAANVTTLGTAFKENTDIVSFTELRFFTGLTEICEYAFYKCTNLFDVHIPDNVTSIGEHAFTGCNSFANLPLFNNVTSIGYAAFSVCESLTYVDIPNSVSSIGYQAFNGCKNITTVIIPEDVISIDDYAFNGCSKLKEVYCLALVPPSVGTKTFKEYMPIYVYDECLEIYKSKWSNEYYKYSICGMGNYPSEQTTTIYYTTQDKQIINSEKYLVKSNTYSNGVGEMVVYGTIDKIDAYTFNAKTLLSITIPESVTSIDCYAFYGCDNLSSIYGLHASEDSRCWVVDGVLTTFVSAGLTEYTIPNDVITIGSHAFRYSNLQSVIIGSNVVTICENAFSDVDTLMNVTIADSVAEIQRWAFYDCESLTTVTIGSGIKSIGEEAFYRCKNITTVYCKAMTPPVGGSLMFHYVYYQDIPMQGTIYVPASEDNSIVDAYRTAPYWSEYADKIAGYTFDDVTVE